MMFITSPQIHCTYVRLVPFNTEHTINKATWTRFQLSIERVVSASKREDFKISADQFYYVIYPANNVGCRLKLTYNFKEFETSRNSSPIKLKNVILTLPTAYTVNFFPSDIAIRPKIFSMGHEFYDFDNFPHVSIWLCNRASAFRNEWDCGRS